MTKKLWIVAVVSLVLSLPAVALGSDQEDDANRIQRAATVFQEIMSTPDKGIPNEILESAKCIAIIPGEKKFALVFGGSYGRGLATCRIGPGWTAPIFLAVEGGSVGYQIGGSSTDLVMIFTNEHALQNLLRDKFKLGADATVAAGPVGRNASAGTDVTLHAEILSYSRARGVFAGISLDGATVRADRSGDHAMYGPNVTREQILHGQVPAPPSAQPLLGEISHYATEARG